MKVSDLMTRDVRVISPNASIREAARLMDDLNVGVLPVCDGRRLVGIITDRDITVRAVAFGYAPDRVQVDDIMTDEVRSCREDDPAEDVLRTMSEVQIRRLPVVDRDKRLVGILSLGDLATEHQQGVRDTLERISTPSEPDRSGTLTQRRADMTRGEGPPRAYGPERGEGPAMGGGRGASADDGDDGRYRGGAVRGGSAGFDDGRGGGYLDDDRFGARDPYHPGAYEGGAFRGDFAGYGRDGGPGGYMRGGFGGGGYLNYGGEESEWGADNAGGPGYAGAGGYGSRRDGTPRHSGLGGLSQYDRGVESDRGRDFGTRAGRTVFDNDADRGSNARGLGGGARMRDRGGEDSFMGRGPRDAGRTDDRIREDVCERLTDDDRLDATEIDVTVDTGEVVLSGTVADREAKRRAEDLAETVRGVRNVQNNLRTSQSGTDWTVGRTKGDAARAGQGGAQAKGANTRAGTARGGANKAGGAMNPPGGGAGGSDNSPLAV